VSWPVLSVYLNATRPSSAVALVPSTTARQPEVRYDRQLKREVAERPPPHTRRRIVGGEVHLPGHATGLHGQHDFQRVADPVGACGEADGEQRAGIGAGQPTAAPQRAGGLRGEPVTGCADAALVSLALPAAAVMAPPGCTAQVVAVAAARAAGPPRAATRTAAAPAARPRAYLVSVAACLQPCQPNPATRSTISLVAISRSRGLLRHAGH